MWETLADQQGDVAFYGPKIDISVSDSLKRKFQCATLQFDFQLPKQFELCYYTEDEVKRVMSVMIHRAILGSVERMFAILLEHYKGNGLSGSVHGKPLFVQCQKNPSPLHLRCVIKFTLPVILLTWIRLIGRSKRRYEKPRWCSTTLFWLLERKNTGVYSSERQSRSQCNEHGELTQTI